jgi:methyl-accepting chemotaxis protein
MEHVIAEHAEAINDHADGLEKLRSDAGGFREAILALAAKVNEQDDRIEMLVAKVNELTDMVNAMSGLLRLL